MPVCGGGSLSREIFKCPICEKRSRILSQHSFSGYVVTNFCGSCGNAWQDGVLLDSDKEDLVRHKKYVKENWKYGRPLKEVIEENLKELRGD